MFLFSRASELLGFASSTPTCGEGCIMSEMLGLRILPNPWGDDATKADTIDD